MKRLVLVALVLATATLTAAAPQRRRKASRPVAVGLPAMVTPRAFDADAYAREIARERQEIVARQQVYRGIFVTPHPAAKGATKVLHEQIAGLMTRLDFVPQQRLAAYGWVPDHLGATITGWHGQVADVSPVPGGYNVTVMVAPRLSKGGMQLPMSFREQYFYDGLSIQLIDAAGPSTPLAGLAIN